MNRIIWILLLLLISTNVFAQCDWYSNNTACTSNAPTALGQSITCTPPDNNAGRRNFVVNNMLAGNIYRISNCNSGFDTQLTVRDAVGNVVGYNDDNGPACTGSSASLDFVCPSNGQYRIQLNRFNCQTGNPFDNGTITVSLISNSTTTCSTIATSLTASSSTLINWYSSSCNGTLIGTGASITVTPAVTTTYYASSSSWSTCMTTTINVTPSPTNVNAGNDVSICSGSSTQLSGSSTNTLNGTKNYYFTASGYDWDNFRIGGTTSGMPANAIITSIIYSPTIGPDCNDWYEWDLMVNNNYIISGCNASNLLYNGLNGQMANNQLLQLRSWNNDWFYDFVTMSVMFTINYSYIPNITYTWSPTTGLSNPNISNPIASPTTTTTYTMTATANGCSTTDSVVVTVFSNLSAGAHNTNPLTKCIGFNPAVLTFTTNPTGGNSSYTYQWQLNTVDILNATSNTFDPDPILIAGVYSYRCKVTDGCGNTVYTVPKIITIVADPNEPSCLKSPNLSSVCVGTPLTLQNCIFGSQNGLSCSFEYSYSIDGGVSWSSTSSTIPNFSANGTTNLIRARVSNCGSCNASSWMVYSWNINATPSTTNINHN
ncbi:hypothetical protein [Flavobacterium sp.]|uniref:immunoglobulin domain-containing protein n=1 Tax=Flavobacterium sp. TaxID=239 RepID=UPI003341CF6D